MSILNSFDINSNEIINPTQEIKKIADFPETVLAVFSQKFADLILRSFDAVQTSRTFG